MNPPTPAYLPVQVLAGTLIVIATVLILLNKALHRAAWPAPERRRTNLTAALLLLAWFSFTLWAAWSGFFHAQSSRIPTIQFGILLPVAFGLALFWLSASFRRVLAALPQEWIVALQFYRVEGIIFLVLYAAGRLPGVFALPAGIGDFLVGLFAPIVATSVVRRSPGSARRLRTWNLLGLLDLAVALTTGFLSSPSPLQLFALDSPNRLVTAFPLVMIPVFLVPLAILLHLASLQKLRTAPPTPQSTVPAPQTT